MAESTIKNPLNPIDLNTTVNAAGATGTLYAYKIGRLVFVTGSIRPKLTGVNLKLASVYGAKCVNTNSCAQVGGYANASEELFLIPDGNDTILKFNVSAISDLKINLCFIATN